MPAIIADIVNIILILTTWHLFAEGPGGARPGEGTVLPPAWTLSTARAGRPAPDALIGEQHEDCAPGTKHTTRVFVRSILFIGMRISEC